MGKLRTGGEASPIGGGRMLIRWEESNGKKKTFNNETSAESKCETPQASS